MINKNCFNCKHLYTTCENEWIQDHCSCKEKCGKCVWSPKMDTKGNFVDNYFNVIKLTEEDKNELKEWLDK